MNGYFGGIPHFVCWGVFLHVVGFPILQLVEGLSSQLSKGHSLWGQKRGHPCANVRCPILRRLASVQTLFHWEASMALWCGSILGDVRGS